VLAAIGRLGLRLPIVVRLDGTNEGEGRALLAAAGRPNLLAERTMLGAARRAVALAAASGPAASGPEQAAPSSGPSPGAGGTRKPEGA
jgi:hypothetical protein